MGRPRNAEETRQLSIKMLAGERLRLLQVALHQSGTEVQNIEDFNLSQWVRERLRELMDAYEAQFPEGRATVEQNYLELATREYERKIAEVRRASAGHTSEL